MNIGSSRHGFDEQRRALGLVICGLVLGGATWAFDVGDEVRVNADRVNVRARPGLNYEVVHQLDFGDTLTVVEREGEEWVGVEPPSGAFAWIHQDYVSDGKVSVARLNARSGPGINYSVLGRLGRGAEVAPVETFGEWIKIPAPRDGRLWVHQDYLDPVAAPAPEAPTPATGTGTGWVTMSSGGTSSGGVRQVVSVTRAEPPEAGAGADAPQSSSSDPADPAVQAADPEDPADTASLPYPPPEDMDLVPLEGQGGAGSYEGSLSRVKYLIGRPTRFELVSEKGGRRSTVCYVHGNRDQLDGLVGRNMRVTGKTYWIQDLKCPVMVPEKIHLDPHAADAP